MNSCVPSESLRLLLALELPPEQRERVEEHVENCPACQSTLDALTREEPLSPSKRGESSELDPGLLSRLTDRKPELPRSPEGIGSWSKWIQLGSSIRSLSTASEAGTRIPQPTPRLPGYQIFRELGRGGMGVVYHAVQTRLNRPCAIKMLIGGAYGGEESVIRLLQEAEIVARLRHPNVVQIHQVGDYDGHCFLELEYLEGGSLSDRLDGSPWRSADAARLIARLARAVQAAHDIGVVHRDIKPGNILFSHEDVPKVADFGLAKSGGGSGLTQTNAILGSPSYMAPEQAAGAKDAGPSVDIYSLGAILFELITGRPPHRGVSAVETLSLVRDAEPVSPSRLVPGVPTDLTTITLKCLNKDPGRRYATAGELADDLERHLDGHAILGKRERLPARTRRWCRRNPVLAVASSVAVGAILALLGVLVVSNLRLTSQGERLNTALSRTEEEERRSRSLLAEMALDKASALAEADQNGPALIWAAEADRSRPGGDPLLDRRVQVNLASLRQTLPALIRVFQVGGMLASLVASHDGSTLACGDESGRLLLLEARTGRTLHDLRVPEGIARKLRFSPDGRRLLVVSDLNRPDALTSRVFVYETASGRTIGEIPIAAGSFGVAEFTPDGTRIVTSVGRDAVPLIFLDAETLRPASHELTVPGGVNSIAFDPTGRTIALARVFDDASIVSAETGKAIAKLPSPADHLVAFGPDGRHVATGGGMPTGRRPKAQLWNPTTGAPVGESMPHGDRLTAMVFSPDGRVLATGCQDGTARLWDAATGKPLCSPLIHAGSVCGVAFTADGDDLVTACEDGAIRTWDFGGIQPRPLEVLPVSGETTTLAPAPDGVRVFVGSRGGLGALWDLNEARPWGRRCIMTARSCSRPTARTAGHF